MRTVLKNSSEVMHVFAQRIQNEGRSGNVFFEGNTIYSYGRHYPAATFHDNKRGTLVLTNSRSYSVTTSGHMSGIRSALSQYEQVAVPIPNAVSDNDHVKNMAYIQDEIDRFNARALMARKNTEYFLQRVRDLVRDGNKYIAFFRLKHKKFVSTLSEMDKKKLGKRVEAYRAQVRDEARKARARHEEEAQNWINRIGYNRPHGDYVYLRMKDDNTVESSKGAEFPLSHGLLALRKIRECVKTKTGWKRNGSEIRVGLFHIDEIDPKGNVRAGCHKIKYSEIERFAKSIGQ